MFRPIRLLILTGLLVAAVTPSVAHGKAQIGVSDNKPNMFSDPDFKALGAKNVRLLVGWDVPSQGSRCHPGALPSRQLDGQRQGR